MRAQWIIRLLARYVDSSRSDAAEGALEPAMEDVGDISGIRTSFFGLGYLTNGYNIINSYSKRRTSTETEEWKIQRAKERRRTYAKENWPAMMGEGEEENPEEKRRISALYYFSMRWPALARSILLLTEGSSRTNPGSKNSPCIVAQELCILCME